MNAPRSQSNPLDALWQVGTIGWMLLAGEGVALMLALAPGVDRPRLQYFWFLSLAIQWVLVCTLTCLYLARSRLQRLRPERVAHIAIGVLLACAWMLAAILGFLLHEISAINAQEWTGLPWRAAAIALTVGLLGLAALHAHWRYQQSLLRVKQAELEALQARIHPHFLFNTLNSAAALVHGRPDDAEQVLLDMSDLFRAALANPGWVPLAHELDLCRRYLAIEQQRFGNRLRTRWELSDGLESLSVPLLSIQPLLENAVAHGMDGDAGKTLQISAHCSERELVVCVSNPIGTASDEPAGSGQRIGLAALRARVDDATGGRGGLETAMAEGMFVARMSLPRDAMPAPE